MQCISKSESTILSLKWQEKLIFVKAKRYEYIYTVFIENSYGKTPTQRPACFTENCLPLSGWRNSNQSIHHTSWVQKTRTSSTFFQKNNLSNNRPPEATEPVLLILVRLN